MNELMSLCIGSDLFSGTIMLVNDGGKEHFSQNLKKMIEENNYVIPGPGLLNNTGYQFINNESPEAVLEIFKLNVELFPDNPNGYDSLGEAYMMTGNKKEAEANYERVLQMDPQNENAKRMLEKLSKM